MLNKRMIGVTKKCCFCGCEGNLIVSAEGYYLWAHEGISVQNAFPELTSSEREFLITGMCDTCQARFFGGDN